MGDFERYLDRYLPDNGDLGSKKDGVPAAAKPGEGRDMLVLDLHGATREEAKSRIDRGLKDALSRGVARLLIIHGKGLNSPGAAVLPAFVRSLLEGHPLAGEVRPAPAHLGGSGALLVKVRMKARKQ